MSYVTNFDIEERLGSVAYVQLADDDGNGVADVGVVDEARLGAEGEVNSYLGRRYSVPISLTTHPDLADVLASFTLDLAEYRLRLRRPPVPDDARRRRDQAIEWLTRVAEGRIELPSAVGVAASSARGTIAAVTGEKRVLTRDELSDH
jgi:phage gp36-like protein